MNQKPMAQLSLETILQQNKEEAKRLQDAAAAKLAENAAIQAEMSAILKSVPPPPVSRLMTAFQDGVRASHPPASEQSVDSTRMLAEKEVLYAALAIVRSWKRRRKKNWQAQEKELMNAVERLTWDR